VVRHGLYVTFQLAEVAIPLPLFADILLRIDRFRQIDKILCKFTANKPKV